MTDAIQRLRHAALSCAQRLRATRAAIGADSLRGFELLRVAEALEDAALDGNEAPARPLTRDERIDRAIGGLDIALTETRALEFEMQAAIVNDMITGLIAAKRA
jgi:hypothetical protein